MHVRPFKHCNPCLGTLSTGICDAHAYEGAVDVYHLALSNMLATDLQAEKGMIARVNSYVHDHLSGCKQMTW